MLLKRLQIVLLSLLRYGEEKYGSATKEEREKVSLVWVPGHNSNTGNVLADIEAKTTLDEAMHPTETYPPQALATRLTTLNLLNHEISNGRRATTN
jgi:hypothetical protein